MSLPTVTGRLRAVQYDGSTEQYPAYRVPLRIRFDLILSPSALPFDSVYNEYACSSVAHMDPRDSMQRRLNYTSGGYTDNYAVPYSGFFQVSPQTYYTGDNNYEAIAVMVKNQVLDPKSYYLLTWWYFPANNPSNWLYYYQETPRMDNEAVAVAGGFGAPRKVTKHSIPSSASGTIDLAAYRVA